MELMNLHLLVHLSDLYHHQIHHFQKIHQNLVHPFDQQNQQNLQNLWLLLHLSVLYLQKLLMLHLSDPYHLENLYHQYHQ